MRTLLCIVALLGATLEWHDAHAQQPVRVPRQQQTQLHMRQYSPPQQNVYCNTDSFGHLNCSDGTRVLNNGNGKYTIIPRRKL